MARSACSTFQAGRQSIKAGGCEIPAHADAATLPEKRNRPILHPGGPEHFPPTVQAGYESIKACRVVICKKRNSPVLHLTRVATRRLQLPLTRHHRAGGTVARTCACAWWQLSDGATTRSLASVTPAPSPSVVQTDRLVNGQQHLLYHPSSTAMCRNASGRHLDCRHDFLLRCKKCC